jgi:hypothetical protein
MGKDSRGFAKRNEGGRRECIKSGRREAAQAGGGQQADNGNRLCNLAKMEGSVWRRLELLDEVVGSEIGPVWRAGKAGLRDGMSAMPNDCKVKECSTGATSEGLLRALSG